MNLTYEILWFEDEEEVVNEDIGEYVRKHLRDLGFKPIITHEKDGSRLNELIKNKNYDLIISDLNLGRNETGDKLVESIRTQSIFTEVLLYSAVASDITKIMERNGMIERISFSVGLKQLRTKIINIIDLTLKKIQDVNNMRGLVIAETIDLEIIIEDCVKKYFNINNYVGIDEHRSKLLNEILDNKKKNCEKILSQIEIEKHFTIDELIDNGVITIYDLYRALQDILKKNISEINRNLNSKISKDRKKYFAKQKEELSSLKEQLNNFNDDIIKLRNTLAHVKEKKDASGVPFLESINKNGLKILFNDDKYPEIRKNLNKHHENLIKIKNMLDYIIESKEQIAADKLNTYK